MEIREQTLEYTPGRGPDPVDAELEEILKDLPPLDPAAEVSWYDYSEENSARRSDPSRTPEYTRTFEDTTVTGEKVVILPYIYFPFPRPWHPYLIRGNLRPLIFSTLLSDDLEGARVWCLFFRRKNVAFFLLRKLSTIPTDQLTHAVIEWTSEDVSDHAPSSSFFGGEHSSFKIEISKEKIWSGWVLLFFSLSLRCGLADTRLYKTGIKTSILSHVRSGRLIDWLIEFC